MVKLGRLAHDSTGENFRPAAMTNAAKVIMAGWVLFSVASLSEAQESNSIPLDKSRYNFFNPVPGSLMRELNADRPDKTDCPFTVDAGHFQIEMDFANMTYNQPNSQRGNVRFTALEAAPVNLKVGLLNNLDFQLVYTTYQWEKTDDRDTGIVERKSGFDGITPRLQVEPRGQRWRFLCAGAHSICEIAVELGASRKWLDRKAVWGFPIPLIFRVGTWAFKPHFI